MVDGEVDEVLTHKEEGPGAQLESSRGKGGGQNQKAQH